MAAASAVSQRAPALAMPSTDQPKSAAMAHDSRRETATLVQRPERRRHQCEEHEDVALKSRPHIGRRRDRAEDEGHPCSHSYGALSCKELAHAG